MTGNCDAIIKIKIIPQNISNLNHPSWGVAMNSFSKEWRPDFMRTQGMKMEEINEQ